MALSPVEDRYLNTLTAVQFPDQPVEPDTPAEKPVMLAMGGSGAGVGRVDRPISDVGTALLDTGAGVVRGAVAQTLGIGGDLQMLFNGLKSVFNRPEDQGRLEAFYRGMQQGTLLPTTEDMGKMLPPVVPAGAADAKSRQHNANIGQTFGEFAPLPGLVDAGVAGVKAGVKATKGMPAGLSIKDVSGQSPNVVSTRLPTAKKATEDPLASRLVIDLQAAKADPKAFDTNMSLVQQYPNFTSKARNPDGQAEDFITHVKDNLLYLYDQVPEQTRQRSKLWYDGARNIVDRWGNEYGAPDQALSGVLAVLSPQKDWFMNVSLGQRVLDIATKQREFRWAPEMDATASRIFGKPQYEPLLNAVRGKTYAELDGPVEKALWLRTYDEAFNPREHRIVMPEGDFGDIRLTQSGNPYKVGWGSLNEIGKAISILENPSVENISSMLGDAHKVRNFYNNIYAPGDPAGHVTIDTHAVAAGLLRPLSGGSREVMHNFGGGLVGERGSASSSITGSRGTYGLYAEAYRRAAAERGVLPREMQSITWEAVRGLFPDTFKTEKNAQLIDGIWVKYRKGQLTLDEARDEVVKAAGGIDAPEWERAGLRAGGASQVQDPGNAGELSGPGVSRGTAGGVVSSGRANPAAGDSPSVTGGRSASAMGAE